ncbi:MAG: DUF126 domain-containing protein [Proteobacteria bacterium]|nr:DUF126 domain-containing protein [Pseudomonadota bacterium]MBU4471888.1 DUF126 domain-containing protein [Pseudomonadota bacterium]MCG2752836.1 DUF126 domain-containing protein [Desulfobacteraceae bacterium]
MTLLKGTPVFKGMASGPALKTDKAMNFTASFTKIANLLPFRRSYVQDRHHEFYGKNIKGRVLIFPAAIGSTYTGMVILDLIVNHCAPAAMIVQNAEPLLVSGAVLGDTWFQKSIPIVEYQGDDIYDRIAENDWVTVNGNTGEIQVDKQNILKTRST